MLVVGVPGDFSAEPVEISPGNFGSLCADSVSMTGIHGEWKYKIKTSWDENVLARYTIAFYRLSESSWYDEVRHDSHDSRNGEKILAPHIHMKLRCTFKNSTDEAVEEIKKLIDNHLEGLKEIVK